jgi:hypothetical protein
MHYWLSQALLYSFTDDLPASLTVPDSLPVDPCGVGDPEGSFNYQVTAVCTAHFLDVLNQVHYSLFRNTLNRSQRTQSLSYTESYSRAITGA